MSPWLRAWDFEKGKLDAGRWHQGLPFLWSEDELNAFLREFLERVYERVLEKKTGAEIVLDKHPGYSLPRPRPLSGPCLTPASCTCSATGGMSRCRPSRRFAISATARRRFAMPRWDGRSTSREPAAPKRLASSTWSCDTRISWPNPWNRSARAFAFAGVAAERGEVEKIVEQHAFSRMKATRQHVDTSVQHPKEFFRSGRAGSWEKEMRPLDRYLFELSAGRLLHELGYSEPGWHSRSVLESAVFGPLSRLLCLRQVERGLRRLRRSRPEPSGAGTARPTTS